MKKSGLTSSEVTESRAKWGANELTPPKKTSLWSLFLEKFEDPIIRILIIAALLSLVIAFVHNDFTETIGIIAAILLATGVGFWFEVDAGRKFEMLNSLGEQSPTRVLRDGKVIEVAKQEIVKGDIVLIETGEEIPADGTLLEATSLIVNESSLTGESSISKTTVSTQFKADATYPSNMVLKGTSVLEGAAMYEVTCVGDNTEIGKVAKASTEDSGEKTPLTKQLDRLAKIIGAGGFAISILTFLTLLIGHFVYGDIVYTTAQLWMLITSLVAVMMVIYPLWIPIIRDTKEIFGAKVEGNGDKNTIRWVITGVLFFVAVSALGYFALDINPLNRSSWVSLESLNIVLNLFMIAVTMIVMAVPEGLPMSVTLSLALNMRRMLKSNNLVRKMHACETMGAINVICTDKTGTLTKNKMSVEANYFNDFEANKALIFEGIALNSTAHIDFTDKDAPKAIGNPTEASLIFWLDKCGVDYNNLRDTVTKIDCIPFSTERKYMATSVKSAALAKDIVFIKGAPEIISGMCTSAPSELTMQLLECQNRAMRTLAFGYKEATTNDINKEVASGMFHFLGFVAITDPIREDVPEAVLRCMSAGINIKIITGDTPATAKQIAREINLWDNAVDGDINHISGVDFGELSDEEALLRVKDIKIMSRARPTDKQRFVRLLQKLNFVVAVTGDGTNDAPALNFAHVGLSMGSGTSVAKQASDITLIDDSFTSIGSAVMWGRSLYRNIQRFILFQLTINVVAVFTLFISSLFGMEIPLTITQILWINIIMDTFAAAALASLPPSMDVMNEKPRGENDFIITRPMAKNIISFGLFMVVAFLGLLYYILNFTENIAYGLSLYFTIFVMVQFWNMFNAKAYASGNSSAFNNLRNCPAFLFVGLLIVVGQVLITSFGGDMFRCVPISFKDWVLVIAGTSMVLWIGEITRLVARVRARS